jgi:DNA-binding response OmpR family regulator
VNNKPLILIVEPEEETISWLEKELAADYQTLALKDADNLFAVIKDQAPDLVLLALDWPTSNGVELCRQLTERLESKKLPIISLRRLLKRKRIGENYFR